VFLNYFEKKQAKLIQKAKKVESINIFP